MPTLRKPVFVRICFYVRWLYTGKAGACVFRVIGQPETRGQRVPTLRKPVFVRIRFYVCWLYTGKADGGLRIPCYRAA